MTYTEPKEPNTPESYISDPDKAWLMAHAEKPYLEDALILRGMARRADKDPLVAQQNGGAVMGWGTDIDNPSYEDRLRDLQKDTLDLANRAGNAAGESYD